MVVAKRSERPWARGWALLASPPQGLELAAWVGETAALYPSEERELADLLSALLSAPLGTPPHLLRASFNAGKGHLVLYRLRARRKEVAFALLWWSRGSLPEAWLGGEPPPGEVLALFREGRRLLREVGAERLAELWRAAHAS